MSKTADALLTRARRPALSVSHSATAVEAVISKSVVGEAMKSEPATVVKVA